MIIIDKRKDYYDYMQGVIGQDPKAVYDRRNAICITKGNMPYCFQPIIPPDIDGYMGIIYLFCGNIVYTFYFENFGKGVLSELLFSKRIKRTTTVPLRIAINTDIWKEASSFNLKSRKYYNRAEMKKQIIRAEERRSEWKDYKKEDKIAKTSCKRPTEWYDNPILFSFPLPIIPAEELFLNLQEFILSQNDKPILDNRTDKQKLEAAGFDSKTSFRKM